MSIKRDTYEDEDQVKENERDEQARRIKKEFDCPSCNANNPTEAPLQDRDEIICNYCGAEYRVMIGDNGKLKLKEL